MAGFFNAQLDFIFFFYGLAFIALGAACLEIERGGKRNHAWVVLGSFAFLHGVGEWLDLAALTVGDAPMFAWTRAALMTGSFALLLEFARLEGIRLGWRLPGRWLHLLLFALVVIAGAAGGVSVASAVARYFFGFGGALATSVVFTRIPTSLSGHERRFATAASLGFALYAVAAGAIVAPAPIWPATVVNQLWFVQLTGLPIQLVRGVLACWIALSIWGIWGLKLIRDLSSERYARSLRQQFVWTLAAMTAILISGWMLTEFLGRIYQRNMQAQAQSDIDLIVSGFSGETAAVEATARVLAGSPSMIALLDGGGEHDRMQAQKLLDLGVESTGAKRGYLLDESGAVVASSKPEDPSAPEPANVRSAPEPRSFIAGQAVSQFAFDAAGASYEARYPVRSNAGDIVGVAVLQKSLAKLEADLSRFDNPYFFVDPDGVVALTNRPAMLRRVLWPRSVGALTMESAASAVAAKPSIEREIADATRTTADGGHTFVRRFGEHGRWSLVLMRAPGEMVASRFLGIVVTLLVTMMVLIVFFGRERRIHDTVQAGKRVKLQQLAQELEVQANTDSLTGLYNRLKFNQALAVEMLRADRYKTPFSLMLFDIDRFKKINDAFGHQIGDKVLARLSRIVANRVRATDLLARWGGEEFAIVASGSDQPMAEQAAEKLRVAIAAATFDDVGRITCSFGLAQFAEGDTADTLLARADSALYLAKLNGRNRVEVAPAPRVVEEEPTIAEPRT